MIVYQLTKFQALSLKRFLGYLGDKISFWLHQSGLIPEREITRTRKKIMDQLFCHEESIYEVSKP